MRVFFNASKGSGAAERQPFVDEILQTLRKRNVIVVTPDDNPNFQENLFHYQSPDASDEKAQYTFITQSIAEADVVILEVTQEEVQLGHQLTLALLYGKPTLVLSQKVDYARHVHHELLMGGRYETSTEVRHLVRSFIDKAGQHLVRSTESVQTIEAAADALHMAALAAKRRDALQDTSEVGEWARLAEQDVEKARQKILEKLGDLPIGKPWSAFAPIYSEDTPDYVFSGVSRFVQSAFQAHAIAADDLIVNAVAGTGAVARNLLELGFHNILAFDDSREMLAESFRQSAHLANIKIGEEHIGNLRLPQLAKGMVWVDYRSNFALDTDTLQNWLQNLLTNIQPGGCLVFDVRTATGWSIDFHRKVSVVVTDHFQRIGITTRNTQNRIDVDHFIRVWMTNQTWSEWRREQMQERMWSWQEVRDVVQGLDCKLEGVYGDDFALLEDGDEPGLAYFVVGKPRI